MAALTAGAGIKYNMPAYAPQGADNSGAANGAVTGINANLGQLGPTNPALWLLGIGAITLGLVAFSTHVRVGGVSASVST